MKKKNIENIKTLLLDKVYRPIEFISYRRMVKLYFTNKIEIVSYWYDYEFFNDIQYPSIVKLKKYIRKKDISPKFNFKSVMKRDHFTCMYTGEKLPKSQLTIDHVIPRSRGGKSSWENCVTASLEVNSKKADKTPEEVGLTLIKKPAIPRDFLFDEYFTLNNDQKHEDWKDYFITN